MTYKVLLLSSISLLFIACGSGGGGSSDNNNENPITFNPNAFNSYDATTFAASTCTNLPLEVPTGIFVSKKWFAKWYRK